MATFNQQGILQFCPSRSGNGHIQPTGHFAVLPKHIWKWPHSTNRAFCSFAQADLEMATFNQQGILQFCPCRSGNGHIQPTGLFAVLPMQIWKWPHSTNKAFCSFAHADLEMATFNQQGFLQFCPCRSGNGHIRPTGLLSKCLARIRDRHCRY